MSFITALSRATGKSINAYGGIDSATIIWIVVIVGVIIAAYFILKKVLSEEKQRKIKVIFYTFVICFAVIGIIYLLGR